VYPNNRQARFSAAAAAIGVRFNFWLNKAGKQKHSPLTLKTRMKLLKSIQLKDVIPNQARADKIEILWQEFVRLYSIANSGCILTADKAKQFRQQARDWLCLFKEPFVAGPDGAPTQCGMFDAARITPYCHVFAEHLYGYLTKNPFALKDASQQGLEGSNGDRKTRYFRQTNRGTGRRRSDPIRDVLQIELQMLLLEEFEQEVLLRHQDRNPMHVADLVRAVRSM